MPTTYHIADADVLTLVARVMERYRPRLHQAAVRIGVLMAHNSDAPAVKHGGYPASATIRVVSLKDRVTKEYDAEMMIDAREFEGLRERQQQALIAHELHHLDTVDLSRDELAARDDGDPVTWKTDDLGRPKLKLVKGDWHAGDGFRVVVQEFGADAIEFENIARAKAHADAARRQGDRERGEP
ncbi:MAG TPA: putative metallopeptidase [Gemmata sp.]